MKKKAKDRPKTYEPKLELDKKVEFDDLFQLAIHHDIKRKVVKKAKKR